MKTSIENKSVAAWEWAHAGLRGKERRRKMDLQGHWWKFESDEYAYIFLHKCIYKTFGVFIPIIRPLILGSDIYYIVIYVYVCIYNLGCGEDFNNLSNCIL